MLRGVLKSVVIITVAAAFAACPTKVSGRAQANTEGAQTIEVAAKKYDFTPAEIRVKAGARVRLVITATDRDHGIEIDPVAEGAGKKGEPGLKFDASVAKPEFKLPKGQPVTIEFSADKAGTYAFKCSVFCGMGHHGMKGQIIVEP